MIYFTKYENELSPKYNTSVSLEEHVKKAVHYYEVLKCKFGDWSVIAEAREQYLELLRTRNGWKVEICSVGWGRGGTDISRRRNKLHF